MAQATHQEADHHSNAVTLLGRQITVEGGIYTVVFVALAILTVIEVVSAEGLKGAIHDAPDAATLQAIKAAILLFIAVIKSTLVIWFYMHLRDEKPLLAVVLLLPLLIAGLSILYLLAIPPGGYSV